MKEWFKIIIEEMISRKINKEIENKIMNNKLYHVTDEKSAQNIMKHNYFRPSLGTIHIKGLSTTFDPNYVWGGGDIKFVLDYQKLKKDFKLLFIDENLGIDESEIKIIHDSPIMPANKYVTNVIYRGNDKNFINLIKDFLKQ